MTPSELTVGVSRANDRIRSHADRCDVAGCPGGGGPRPVYGVHRIQPGLAQPMAALALAGVLGFEVASRVFSWQRDEIYDDIVLAGFRHVHPAAVAIRARELVSIDCQQQVADTLDRFVAAAVERQPLAVPVHRDALIELQPKVPDGVSTILRRDDVDLEPAGIGAAVATACHRRHHQPAVPPGRGVERAGA